LLWRLLRVPEQLVDDHHAHEAKLEHGGDDGLLPGGENRGASAQQSLQSGPQRIGVLPGERNFFISSRSFPFGLAISCAGMRGKQSSAPTAY
jgi:hypothetical protein